MKEDTLFNVVLKYLDNGYDKRIYGIVKAESISDALEYLKREYPTMDVDSIDKSGYKLI